MLYSGKDVLPPVCFDQASHELFNFTGSERGVTNLEKVINIVIALSLQEIIH